MRTSALRPAAIHALTGLHPAAVHIVVQLTQPAPRPGRPTTLTHPDRVLLVLTALRTNLTERALAAVFGISQPTTHRTIRTLLPAIAALFRAGRTDATTTLLLDGTLIPVHDQSITARSKNYRRSVNIQIVATTSHRIIQLGTAWPGNRNDIIVARATIALPPDVTTLADGAYRSLPGATLPPADDPDQLACHRKQRARIEHVIARIKDWQILRQCRRKANAINHATHAVAYLHNLRLELRIKS